MSTIREVAKAAGVSPATVSHVLNGNTNFSTKPETREKVWKAVNDLQYIPVSTCSKKNEKEKSWNIGTVLYITVEKMSDPSFLAILQGIEFQLKKYNSSISSFRVSHEIDEVIQSMADQQIDGFICMQPLEPHHIGKLKNICKHVVMIDGYLPNCDSVSYDHYGIGEMAAQHFLSLGHHRFAFMCGQDFNEPDPFQEQTLNAFRYTIQKAGGVLSEEHILRIPKWRQSIAYEEIKKMMQKDHPTALFCTSDLLAMTSIGAINACGYKIPSDIALMGITNIEATAYSTPPLTTISLPLVELGKKAADLLIARLNGMATLPERILYPTELIVRTSTIGASSDQ